MGEVGGRILTDGRRIYFASTGKNPLRYVSVNGGEATAIPSPVSHLLQTLDISRDGSYLLVKEFYGARGGFEAPVWLLEVNSGAARKLGDIEAQDAAFAPDGKTIVVARDRELYLTDIQGANPLKLAEATGKIGRPRWSPDGQRLRFHVWDGTQALTLWELSQNGVPHQLFKGWKMAGGVCCGEWTADGKYYLFQSNRQYWSAPEHSGLTHSEPTLLTTMGANVITAVSSPLANTIYVNVEQGSGNVFKWDVDPNHAPSILYQDLKAATLEFSRDGQWVAYSHKAPDGYELWRARADGSDKQQLTTSFIGIFKIRYSPDGSKIAIMAIQNKGRCKIYWVSADGGGLREIPSPITDQGDPAWSPDSQSIMFGLPPEGFGGAGAGVVRRIYLYDLRMGKTTEVPGSANLFNARWSPDGKYVVAVAADFQGMSLLDTTTSKWRPLTLHQPTDYPSWSPDGAWIYFNNVGDTNLSRVRVRDGQVESLGPIPLPSGYSSCSMVAFVADGAALLECGDSRTDVFALDYKEEK